MNPLQEAKRRAADQLSAILARYPGETDLEDRLVNLVEGTIHRATEGFCRQDPRARERPSLDPTWIPVAPAELFDRLEAAGLVRRDEKENQWVWSFEWFGALLGMRALKRGSAEVAAERLESWLIAASSTASMDALSLLAEERFEEPSDGSLQPFLEKKIGISALAGAVALRAPAEDPNSGAAPGEANIASALAAFSSQLDRLFGLPQALGAASDKFRVAQILDRAEAQLRGIQGLGGARQLLRRRLVAVLDSAAAVTPRDPQVLRALGKALVSNAEADGSTNASTDASTVGACDDCARALAIGQRLRALAPAAPADPWLRSFLRRVCVCAIQLPHQGDRAPFATLYKAVFAALAGLPEDPHSLEAELRERVTLLVRSIELNWEARPGDTLELFEKALEILDRLLELAPADRRYLEGKREFLLEFALRLESSNPARAELFRAEAERLDRELTPVPPPETPAESPQAAPSAAPAVEPAPPRPGASRDELLAAISAAWSIAASDPIAAIAAAQRVAETLFRGVLAHEMGPPPGKPSYEDLVKWLRETQVLPERFRQQLVVLEWHVGMSLEELSSSRMFGSAPGVVCCAAMTRLVRWYFEVYLQTELPAEMGEGGPRVAAAGASKLRLVSAARTQRRAALSREEEHASVRQPGPTRIAAKGAIVPAEAGAGGLHPAQEAAARELGIPLTIQDPLTGMSMVLVPGGEVWVEEVPVEGTKADGERPRHRVQVRPFYCAVTPVLQEAWSRFMEGNPSHHVGQRLPVANLSWEEVQTFLARANQGRTGPPLRLLREAEWYRAARAGAESAFWWGGDYRPGWANCSDDGVGSGFQEPSEPGQYPANPFGILDAYGNVWEWCLGPAPSANQGVRAFGAARESVAEGKGVLCGGSWKSFPGELARTRHLKDPASARFDDFGFRCGRDVE